MFLYEWTKITSNWLGRLSQIGWDKSTCELVKCVIKTPRNWVRLDPITKYLAKSNQRIQVPNWPAGTKNYDEGNYDSNKQMIAQGISQNNFHLGEAWMKTWEWSCEMTKVEQTLSTERNSKFKGNHLWFFSLFFFVFLFYFLWRVMINFIKPKEERNKQGVLPRMGSKPIQAMEKQITRRQGSYNKHINIIPYLWLSPN